MPEENKIQNREIEKRLTSLEVLMTDTREDVKDIKDNHLPTIYNKIDAQKSWLIGVLILIIMTLIGTIVNFLK